MNSDQNRAASRLMSAYTDGDVEEIKRAAQSNIVSNLDHVVSLLIHSEPFPSFNTAFQYILCPR